MQSEQFDEIRKKLLKMRDEILDGVQQSYEAGRDLGQDGVPDIGDMSSTTYSKDVLFNLGETQRRTIQDIDAALERIDNDEYGLCARCEEEISSRRMEVRPFSRYCVDCKSEVEKFGE